MSFVDGAAAAAARFMVYTCLPDGRADEDSVRVQLYSRAKTMRQICADVKSSLNLTLRVDTRLSLKKLEEAEQGVECARAGGCVGCFCVCKPRVFFCWHRPR